VLAANGDLYGVTYFGAPAMSATFTNSLLPRSDATVQFLLSKVPARNTPRPASFRVPTVIFYGVTQSGGDFNGGFVYKITPSGSLTTLYSFCSQKGCADGEVPVASLIQAVDGNFYGTTSSGGAYGHGTVFSISSGGLLTTIYSFLLPNRLYRRLRPRGRARPVHGWEFFTGPLITAGATNLGTVFRITPSGTFTTLHSFCSENSCTDGEGLLAQLIQATDGNFYGAT